MALLPKHGTVRGRPAPPEPLPSPGPEPLEPLEPLPNPEVTVGSAVFCAGVVGVLEPEPEPVPIPKLEPKPRPEPEPREPCEPCPWQLPQLAQTWAAPDPSGLRPNAQNCKSVGTGRINAKVV